jgi:hypothetical protein
MRAYLSLSIHTSYTSGDTREALPRAETIGAAVCVCVRVRV